MSHVHVCFSDADTKSDNRHYTSEVQNLIVFIRI